MRRHLLSAVWYALPLALVAGLLNRPDAAETGAATGRHAVALNGHTFTLPAGFTIELAAGLPLVERPVAAAFTEAGDLIVTESSGTNDPPAKQLKDKPHKLLRLSAVEAGKFHLRTTVADRLMMPQGVAVVGNDILVGTPPSIWKYENTHAKPAGVEWFAGPTLTGCTNDLHGPYPGPDGKIYWTKGAFARQTYTLPGGKPFTTRAAHIFRANADGTGIEPVMTGGMDNPVDVVFTATGDRLFSTTFLQHPADGKRDGILHAVYGGVFGKDHDPVREQVWTSPAFLPVMTHLGAAAPSGLHRYESTAFGDEFTGNLFCCAFNMAKVTRHVLTADGATYRSRDEDFLVSDNRDFHPTDAIEDADGSLLVVDTGGWYRLCCPTSQLVKGDIPGAIYRVRRLAAPNAADPRGLKLPWATLDAAGLAALLGDARPAVRTRAVRLLALKSDALPQLELTIASADATVAARCHALWVAARLGVNGLPLARTALGDRDESVRRVALHLLAGTPDKASTDALIAALKAGTPHEQRVAAEALGRTGDPRAVPALVAGLTAQSDRVLHHAFTYALIETGDAAAVRPHLTAADPSLARAALAALHALPGGLTAKDVLPHLTATDAAVHETAWWVVGRTPVWHAELAAHFAARPPQELTPRVLRDLTTLVNAPAVQRLLKDGLARELAAVAHGATAHPTWDAVGESGLKFLPAEWAGLVHPTTLPADPASWRLVARLLRRIPPRETEPSLQAAAVFAEVAAAAVPFDAQVGLLAALPGPLPEGPDAWAHRLLDGLHHDTAAELRSAAAAVLVRTKLTPAQYDRLAAAVPTAGVMEVQRLVEHFAAAPDAATGKLLTALATSPVRTSLRGDALTARYAKATPGVKEAVARLVASLNVNAADQKGKLDALQATLAGGDARRGQAVFNSAKAACATCHAIGYLGGKLGPDLTRIGGIRSERDLLEAIVYPSASFVRSYEPVTVDRLDGRSVSGILKKDAPDEVVVSVSATEDVRIPRADIELIVPGRVSVMPSGLDQQLSPRDLADLVAFLKASK